MFCMFAFHVSFTGISPLTYFVTPPLINGELSLDGALNPSVLNWLRTLVLNYFRISVKYQYCLQLSQLFVVSTHYIL